MSANHIEPFRVSAGLVAGEYSAGAVFCA
jgi:hypothetical protein